MLEVKDAKYERDYKIKVIFNDNKEGVVDLKSFIKEGRIKPFKRLQNIDIFKDFKVDYTIKWDDELDIAPEYLYYTAFKDNPSLKEKFKTWGYVS